MSEGARDAPQSAADVSDALASENVDLSDALIADAMSVSGAADSIRDEDEEDDEEEEEDPYEFHGEGEDGGGHDGDGGSPPQHGDDNADEDDGDGSANEEEEDEAEREAEMQRAREVLLARGYRLLSEPRRAPLLSSFDLSGVAQYIATKPCRNIVVMCGAGISVSAGIPDFRTPGTGLYDNLQKYDLPSPQSIFELSYFRERPDAFYRLCAELWPDNFAPTPTHHFLVELHARGLLRRCFTQNIDSLEAAASMPRDMIVAAHGNFDRCSCIDSGEEVAVEEVREAIANGKYGERGWQALAERHGGLVKPDIVFFGEQLPERFFQCAEIDLAQADLLIIFGTSLKVQPFASLVGLVKEDVPRLLINREQVGTDQQPLVRMLGFIDDRALDFSEEHQYRDACFLGDCDSAVDTLCKLLDQAAAAGASASDGAPPSSSPAPFAGGWSAALQRRIEAQPPPVPKMPPADSLPPVEPMAPREEASSSSSSSAASLGAGASSSQVASSTSCVPASTVPVASASAVASAVAPPGVGGAPPPPPLAPPVVPPVPASPETRGEEPQSTEAVSPDVRSPEHKTARTME